MAVRLRGCPPAAPGALPAVPRARTAAISGAIRLVRTTVGWCPRAVGYGELCVQSKAAPAA
eukprot:SAG25_NODE_1237_length_3527_cov_9.218147_5_plen_61_part_00